MCRASTNPQLEVLEGIDHVLDKELGVLEAGSGLRGTPAARFAGLGTKAGSGSGLAPNAEEIQIITDLGGEAPDAAGKMPKDAKYPPPGTHCGPRGKIVPPTSADKATDKAKYIIEEGKGNTLMGGCVVRYG